MNESHMSQFEDASDIHAEFDDAALAQALLGLRQEPGAPLRQRVRAIPRQQHRAAGRLRRGWRPFIRAGVLAAAAVLAALLLLIASPQARRVTAQALDGLERVFLRVSGNQRGLTALQPAPPFTVKQLGYLPAGLELYGDRYNPGAAVQIGQGSLTGQSQRLDPQTQRRDPVIRDALERDRSASAHLVLAYKSADGKYAVLFERAAQPDEALPAGAPRTVSGQPAVLQQHGSMQKLTWKDAGTWTEIESTLPETELLKIAAGLAPLQPASLTANQADEPTWGDSLRHMFEPVFCDSAQAPPQGVMLGKVEGQKNLGTIWVELFDGDVMPERIAGGWNVPDKRPVIQTALAALRDTTTPMRRLPYQSFSSFSSDGPDGCLTPNAAVQGYLVIEVWEHQVNLGYGGNGAEQKERVIKALEQEMKQLH